jgi:hypothetical protein
MCQSGASLWGQQRPFACRTPAIPVPVRRAHPLLALKRLMYIGFMPSFVFTGFVIPTSWIVTRWSCFYAASSPSARCPRQRTGRLCLRCCFSTARPWVGAWRRVRGRHHLGPNRVRLHIATHLQQINLEAAVGHVRVGSDAVRWQGVTTRRARARKAEQRSQRAVAQLNRA